MGECKASKMMRTGIALALIIAAVTASSIEHETANLEEATDLLQERVSAKVSIAGKAGATVMIGGRQVDAAAVTMAKAKMHDIVHKLGQKHPQFIGDAAGVVDLVEEMNSKVNPDCVKHGFTKLKKVLDKVDALEAELTMEKNAALDG